MTDILPNTWDVTSDTVAAWVAGTLHLDLLLLKSIDGIFINGILREQVTGLVESDIIDPLFHPVCDRKYSKNNNYQWITTRSRGKIFEGGLGPTY